jgi:hypothetical protein
LANILHFFWYPLGKDDKVRRMHLFNPCRNAVVTGGPMYTVSDRVRSTHGPDGGIVLDIEQGEIFRLNFAGSRILELLQCGFRKSEIVESIRCEFDIGQNLAERDVQEFLKMLQKHGLIEKQLTTKTA